MIKDEINNIIQYLKEKDYGDLTIYNLEYCLEKIKNDEKDLNQYVFVENNIKYDDIKHKMEEYLLYASKVNREKRESRYQYWINKSNEYRKILDNYKYFEIKLELDNNIKL